jgi:hypothetical protein
VGVAYLTWINDDGVRDATDSPTRWDEMKEAVGEAVLKLCLRPDIEFNARIMQRERETAHPIRNHGNAVNFCDEVHSTDQRVYLWFGNCLRSLRQLPDSDLERVAALLKVERENRRLNA